MLRLFLRMLKKTILGVTFNIYEKEEIKESIKNKLHTELAEKAFLKDKKFEIMDEETEKIMREFGLGY